MKLKNISFMEQHVEKIALLVAVLITLVVIFFFVVKTPYTTSGGRGGPELTPAKVNEVVAEQAKRLGQKLKQTEADPVLRDHKDPKYLESFVSALQTPLMTRSPLAVWDGPQPVNSTSEVIEQDYPSYESPAPKVTVVRANLLTIVSQEVDKMPALKEFFKNHGVTGPPYDLQTVTVAGTFDMAALRASITREAPGFRKVSERDIDTVFALTDVVLQRQEQLPDGSWSEPITVAQSPNQMPTRALKNPIPHAETQRLVLEFLKNQTQIINPIFPEVMGENGWQAPLPPSPDPKTPEIEENPAIAPANQAKPDGQTATAVRSILHRDVIHFWADDFTAMPAKNYKYRAMIVFTNPHYGLRGMPEKQRLIENKRFLADKELKWSDWSDMVSTEPAGYFRVVSASPNSRGSVAKIDLFRYYNGAWRKAQFGRVMEGDPIGEPTELTLSGKKVIIDFSTGAYLANIAKFKMIDKQGFARETQIITYTRDGKFFSKLVLADKNDEQLNAIEAKVSDKIVDGTKDKK